MASVRFVYFLSCAELEILGLGHLPSVSFMESKLVIDNLHIEQRNDFVDIKGMSCKIYFLMGFEEIGSG